MNQPTAPPWLRLGDGYLTVELSVRPAAGRCGIVRVRPSGPLIALNSAPEKGRANRELIDFLAGFLHLPPSSLSIIKGETSRSKVVRVRIQCVRSIAAKLLALQ